MVGWLGYSINAFVTRSMFKSNGDLIPSITNLASSDRGKGLPTGPQRKGFKGPCTWRAKIHKSSDKSNFDIFMFYIVTTRAHTHTPHLSQGYIPKDRRASADMAPLADLGVPIPGLISRAPKGHALQETSSVPNHRSLADDCFHGEACSTSASEEARHS